MFFLNLVIHSSRQPKLPSPSRTLQESLHTLDHSLVKRPWDNGGRWESYVSSLNISQWRYHGPMNYGLMGFQSNPPALACLTNAVALCTCAVFVTSMLNLARSSTPTSRITSTTSKHHQHGAIAGTPQAPPRHQPTQCYCWCSW